MPFERISTTGLKPVTIWVDGREIEAHEGESLHAALCLAGVLDLGQRLDMDHGRGVFCGMGVCFECLVTIDGQPNQRACMTPVRAGMKVDTGHA
jgi:predicted molibdopterin-dependent oxidoreductase YjgC